MQSMYDLHLNNSLLSSLHISDPCLWNSDNNQVFLTKKANKGDEVSIEADLRSGEREERRIRFLVNGQREKTVIVGVPESIRFGVCVISLLFFSHLSYSFIVKVSLYDKYDEIEFLRVASVKELDGIGLDGSEEKRVEWGRGRGKEYTPLEALNGVRITKRINTLSSLSLHISSNGSIKTEGNQIIHHGGYNFDTCIIDREMRTVLSSLLFSLLHSLFITGYL